MLPEAHIGILIPGRVRIRIPDKKGQSSYFSDLLNKLSGDRRFEKLVVNPITGSVLFLGRDVDVAAITESGEANHLFRLETGPLHPVLVSNSVANPIGKLSKGLQEFTGGELDLKGMVILGLIGVGLYQIIKGNLRAPPWYTAFWYALGIFTKSFSDKDQGTPA